jgi:nucleoside phosphorylase
MPEKQSLDLYDIVLGLSKADWIEQVYIFGSRRYLSNASYGSDIDLLIVPNRAVQTDKLRALISEQYVDAFLLDGTVAISAANETRINLADSGMNRLDAVALWSRTGGWLTGEDYRVLYIIADKVPTVTVGTAGARPVILFCALTSEFGAVKDRLPEGVHKTHARIPPYYLSSVKTKTGRERLVVAVQTGVAGVNAGISATRILDYFEQPELAILVGITAGVRDSSSVSSKLKSFFYRVVATLARRPPPDSVLLGNVLVPIATIDVESGKVTPKGKEPAGLKIPVSPNHQRAVASWPGYAAWAARWQREVGGALSPPKILADCTLACTASVIAYNAHAQSLRKLDRKIAGIEMEAVGIAMACLGRCPFLVVKSISDWADEQKGDSVHSYCMKVSADLAISMIEDETI